MNRSRFVRLHLMAGALALLAFGIAGCPGKKPEETPTPTPTPATAAAQEITIDIVKLTNGTYQVSQNPHCSRNRKDLIRWRNLSDRAWVLSWKDDATTIDDDQGPIEDGKFEIALAKPASTTEPTYSGWFRIAKRTAEAGKSISFTYKGDVALSGPPGEPGMVVEE